ncbi:hypothetical protein ABH924_004429 [Arthrobacter sp. GAS37]|uniref:Imm52 family immunity protein n=1 Tax=Arthrobacter sp. GAS37 TaxID=3156261 RepID=UPI0038351E85
MTVVDNVVMIMANWGARGESASEVAARTQRMIDLLLPLGYPFVKWAESESGAAWPDNSEEATAFVKECIARDDPDEGGERLERPEFGYQFMLYTGDYNGPDANVDFAFDIDAGSSRVHQESRMNKISVMMMWKDPDQLGELAAPLPFILKAFAAAWQPDYVTIYDDHVREAQPMRYTSPLVGAMTWLADRLGTVPSALEGAKIERFEHGTLIDLRNPADQSFPTAEHVARVFDVLDATGVLGEIPAIQPALSQG